jgi:peptide subunit release factor 1 (eRF1)
LRFSKDVAGKAGDGEDLVPVEVAAEVKAVEEEAAILAPVVDVLAAEAEQAAVILVPAEADLAVVLEAEVAAEVLDRAEVQVAGKHQVAGKDAEGRGVMAQEMAQ